MNSAEAHLVLHYICPDCKAPNTMAIGVTNKAGNPIGNCKRCRRLWTSVELHSHYSKEYGFEKLLNLPPSDPSFNLFTYEFTCECGERNVVFPDGVKVSSSQIPEDQSVLEEKALFQSVNEALEYLDSKHAGLTQFTAIGYFGSDMEPSRAVCFACKQESTLTIAISEGFEKLRDKPYDIF